MKNFKQQFNDWTDSSTIMQKNYRANENELMAILLSIVKFNETQRSSIHEVAEKLIRGVRETRLGGIGLDAFFIQYDMSSEEGIALMCLAEAMLRIPDKGNMDAIIKDKLTNLNWQDYSSNSESWLVNAATWGLVLTGKIYDKKLHEKDRAVILKNLIGRLGEPVVRKSVKQAMCLLGEQFILGTTIKKAIIRANKKSNKDYLYSYDMLGEAAKTAVDAEEYFESYKESIRALKDDADGDLLSRPGISIKLSALHPRYEVSQYHNCIPKISEKVLVLVRMAKEANITVTLDAEESERLELSLEIFRRVFSQDDINSWGGFGLAIQAYQKRAIFVIDYLEKLSHKYHAKILVRLVKGAYWDTELKQSQVMGFSDYPVFTRKFNTDVSFLACVFKIAGAGDSFYGQFATHNAHTVAAILEIYGSRNDFEFQCLHGMGRSLYDSVLRNVDNTYCRMYAPVGNHKELLPYLVRRLLENGANTSFVNRIIDKKIPVEKILFDPAKIAASCANSYHPNIPLPRDLYSPERKNSFGYDLSDIREVKILAKQMDVDFLEQDVYFPLVANSKCKRKKLNKVKITNPAFRDELIGFYHEVDEDLVALALSNANSAKSSWQELSFADRARFLNLAADKLEEQAPLFIAIAIKEAGKLWQDAVDEVREAVDFLRYYAVSAVKDLATVKLPGPTGELNQLSYHARGVVFCISPWNFPLAIFCGQLSAALVAGNVVLAKPASQTVIIATKFIEILYEVGVPKDVIQLLPGPSDISGQPIVSDSRVDAVMLTGSNNTAKSIYNTLAQRDGPIVPLIAETGGMNAMIVDSTALTEQVVTDIVDSAFRSAGQRCSALRVVYIQEEVFDKTISMLSGAMQELVVDNPLYLKTDVGPVIDERAKGFLDKHLEYLETVDAKFIFGVTPKSDHGKGTFFMPRAYEIDSIKLLKEEVFGPILHVIKYKMKDLDNIIDDINATNFGLTFGVHSRIDAKSLYIKNKVNVGNIYINRNIIGAVVGVQPFGGEGLSGTGPKAGGPNYLKRLCHERTLTINTAAVGGNTSLMTLEDPLLP
ncbi:MAG: bifunctional proline dehydrogenase/L-glutamate gamma-semialdehyde dehydrogenase PutA [Pseudomonadota bacterium]|nr:bifunctional proline dehydrogenase/L-glutamate gamma-semialdehyde dehydrogenase PutA [Pseudomonadota bacterium]